MAVEGPGSQIASIDTILALWRQGDCVLRAQWFVHGVAPVAAESDTKLVETQVSGFIIAMQTCDVVRSRVERPFVELCPPRVIDLMCPNFASSGRYRKRVGALAQDSEIAAVTEHTSSFASGNFLDNAESLQIGERCIDRRGR